MLILLALFVGAVAGYALACLMWTASNADAHLGWTQEEGEE